MRKSTRRLPLAGLIILLLLQQLGLMAFAQVATVEAAGALVATPATAEAGTPIALSGQGFTPGETLAGAVTTPYGQTLVLVSSGGARPTLQIGSAGAGAAFVADARGAVSFALVTAANYQPGDWTVTVRGHDSDQVQQGGFTLSAPQVAAATLTPGASPVATPATPPARTTPAGEVVTTPTPAATAQPAPPPAPSPTAVPPTTAPAPSAAATPSALPSAIPSVAPAPSASPSVSPAPATPSAAPGASPSPSAGPGPAAPNPSTASPTAAPSTSPSPIASPTPAPATVSPSGFVPGTPVIINSPTGNAAVREQPSTAAAVVRTLNNGTVLTISGLGQEAEGRSWWPVTGNGVSGWIIADLISAAPAAAPSPSAAPVPTAIGPGTQATVDTPNGAANVRSAPSTSAAIVRSITSGTIVNITGASQHADGYDWWPVQADGTTGWIVADVLTLVAAPVASGSPVPSNSPAPSASPGVPGYSTPGVGNTPTESVPVIPPPIDGPAVAPMQLLPTFAAASALTGVPQEILLAIARVESNFTPNAVGPFIPQLAGTEDEHALGMMQFLPSTYRMVMARVDAATGKNLGIQGIWDPESAIYAAAFYLKDSGAPGDLRRALFSYNNANWYVELILAWASHYVGGAIPDPHLLDPSRTSGTPLAAPQNPLLPSNSRHLDMSSPIQLYAPWTAGETWYAGGDGSFYGDGYHTDAYGNYYTVDFNKGTWPRSEEDDGAPILAAADGIVNNIYQDGAGAWVVELYHVAPDGSQLRTLYVHLKMDPRINPGIKVNQPVLHGTPIGLNGSTGNSTGSHLHFGLWILRDGQWMSIRAEPMEGQYLRNGLSIVSTNRPLATDTGARALDIGLSPAGPSNADLVSIVAAGRADGLPGARIEAFANSAKDGSDRGQWLPIGTVNGAQGQIDWLTAPVAEGTYRLLLVQTDTAGNRTFHGLTENTAIRYTIRRGEPRGGIVAAPRSDLSALIPLDGATLPALGGRPPIVSGPLRFAQPRTPRETSATLGAGAVVAATGAPPSGKVRESEGLLVEEATTNLVTNPSFERGAEGWAARGAAGDTLSVTPSDSALFGKHSIRIDNSKGTAPVVFATTVGDGGAATWSVYARAIAVTPNVAPGGNLELAMAGLVPQRFALTADWQRFAFSGATGTAGNERQIVVPAGVIVEVDGAQLEAKPYATSYADGSLGSGYGWDRAADSSVSGRLPTVVRLPLDGLVTTENGTLAFWATPLGPVADNAVIFALGDRLTLTATGNRATLLWGTETIATMPWEQGVAHHYALTWAGGALTFLHDGQIVAQRDVADFALPTGTALFLGTAPSGQRVINATFQDVAVWPTAPTVEMLTTIAKDGQLLNPGQDQTVTLNVGLALATQGLAPNGIKMQFSFDGNTWTEVEPF
ncbi:MAG TPA: SH3 domain-containing protein, partial [Thermomicrobiales bacterium]